MAFKLVESLIGTVDTACKVHRHFLLKAQSSCFLLKKASFCSKDDEDNSESQSSEAKIKQLLDSSSPLRSTVIKEKDDAWTTSPYPEDTVLKESNERRKKFNPFASKAIILFPGQGNQYVGMGKNLFKFPVAADLFEAANEILKYKLSKICFEGPEHVLNNTQYCQPATFVCSLALLEKLKYEKPWAIKNCVATCGYSLGELTALVFAGCITFETGLRLVKFRAEIMAKCCEKTSGGMLTIITGVRNRLGDAYYDAILHCKEQGIDDPVCVTASYLFPNCKVVGGHTEALNFLIKNGKKYGIQRCSKLPVSGAFHTELMKEAADEFKKKIESIQFQPPLVKVFSNVTGKPYKSVRHISSLLPKQIFCPVLWEQTVHNLFFDSNEQPYPFLYECGPGSSLSVTVKKVNNQAYANCFSVKM